ncbi:zinc metalloprotease HtpX [bacterium]|nr:zinc metalloprotease HtpX [bacterium]|tara:strand:- start:4256 stop:5149 length:894 start_codon:yes stop_codon:yes gene_type:complete
MASIYTHRDKNIRKTWFLMAGFLISVIALGWAASWYFGNPIILYVVAGIAMVMNVVSYWHSDKLVIKMTGAKPVSSNSHRELWNIVENLSITAGLPMPKVYIVEDSAPNAFATGRDPDHAVVAVTTGLLNMLERNELEGVVAHELSHIGNRDMLVSTVAVVLVGFVAILADIFIRMTFFGGNRDRGGALMIILGIAVAILAPIAAKLIHMAISRKREFLADASGVLLTRYPEGLASALEKIGAHSHPMRRANHATAHLFLSDPFSHNKKGFAARVNNMFMTHPPMEERVRALRGDAK